MKLHIRLVVAMETAHHAYLKYKSLTSETPQVKSMEAVGLIGETGIVT